MSDEFLGADGVHIGVNLDWGSETVADYAEKLGRQPADVVSFVPVPWSSEERDWAVQAGAQTAEAGAAHVLTLEPQDGLGVVDEALIEEIVDLLQEITRLGVPVVVRFAHEMNGSWYAWGQQPELYVETFRNVATAVHDQVPGATMMWAPNYGGGYPFTGGAYAAIPGSADGRVLDTDDDGALSSADDPYAPYYPGDEYVDWVGMSLYHWGSRHPWGENEMPEPGKFVQQLRGEYNGLGGDDTAVPDFYAEYGERRGKPVAIPETAALVVDRGDTRAQRRIKQAWAEQVFEPSLREELPALRMINWFEWAKHEPEVDDVVIWSMLDDTETRGTYQDSMPAWALFGDRTSC
ncbi:glycoside hydrolase family 26 protein [Microbacterium sp.]|uniref:glycoside hydrolase family 26 protein n=1 Tax=Microbacterium sp. TaxID=51671 RepID=UPI003735326A